MVILPSSIWSALRASSIHPKIINNISTDSPEKTVYDYLVSKSLNNIQMYSHPFVGIVVTETKKDNEYVRYVERRHPQDDIDEPCLENWISQTITENQALGYAQLMLNVLNKNYIPKETVMNISEMNVYDDEDDEDESPPPRYA